MDHPTFPPEGHHSRTCSCPTSGGPLQGRSGAGHMVHRSWTGKDRPMERWRGTECGHECSQRRGTLLEGSQRPEATVERLLTCQRWGVCDTGTADICGVDSKTGPRCQHVAAHRAQAHPAHVTRELGVEGGPRDERHAKRRGPPVEWRHTALAMRRRFLRWVHGGPRTPERAALLIAQVVARRCGVPVWVSAGGNADPAALVQVLGRVYRRRRRRGARGRHPQPRLVPPRALC
jgi:hypothetical protein